jgi:hypothetical protein
VVDAVGATFDVLNQVSPPAVFTPPPAPIETYAVPPAVNPVIDVDFAYAAPAPPPPALPVPSVEPPPPAPIASTETKAPKSEGIVNVVPDVIKTVLVAI